jgi:carboxymethylenebutenolidase
MSDELTARRVRVAGHDGDEIDAYAAHPLDDGRRGGVVVIHHMPGWDRATKEITRRFAELGYDAICPNLHHREAPGAAPDDAAAASRAAGGVPDDRLLGDIRGAVDWLRALPTASGKVATIGYCSGGRQSFLAATSLPVDAAVDCYGGYVVGTPPPTYPVPIRPIGDRAPQLRCPLLGLFGKEDKAPSPAHVAELEQLLQAAGKDYEFHSYDDAGHGFFAVDRPSYRVAAANDGWERIADFFGRHLA